MSSSRKNLNRGGSGACSECLGCQFGLCLCFVFVIFTLCFVRIMSGVLDIGKCTFGAYQILCFVRMLVDCVLCVCALFVRSVIRMKMMHEEVGRIRPPLPPGFKRYIINKFRTTLDTFSSRST